MTRFELFEPWCTLVESLACQGRTLEASPPQDTLEALVGRFDALMDSLGATQPSTITEATDLSCLWYGEAGGEARCTAALVQPGVEDAARTAASAHRSADERAHWR